MRLEPPLNRHSETAALHGAWEKTRRGIPQLAVLWGRRRVGKTFLLSHFVQGKRSLFFTATRQAEGIELARLAPVGSDGSSRRTGVPARARAGCLL
jgi:AAA+ ATPase superfamily predicted ATPase